MKLLHSKSAAEPILAVSACPCANLFGFVTASAVTVYRSTTLTTVFSFSLKALHTADNVATAATTTSSTQASALHRCCWSPSGRLFTVALPCGMLLIFDVEGGSLARVFSSSLKAAATTTTTAATAASLSPGSAAASLATPASPSSPTSALFPASVPWLPTSLPPRCPVLAMTWCAVPSMSSAQLQILASEVQTRCLPVRCGVTAALFDEVTQQTSSNVADGDGEASGGDVGWGYADSLALHGFATADITGTSATAATLFSSVDVASHQTTSVSLLIVIGGDGVMRCFVGGLYEVCATPLALPPSITQRGLGWSSVSLDDVQVRQCAIDTPFDIEHTSSSVHKEQTDALVAFGDIALDPVRPSVRQHHRLYLTLRQTPSRDTANTPSPSQALWEVCVQERLTALAMPSWVALCHLREYTRIAQDTFTRVHSRWSAVLRGRVCAHLGLPAAAPLLQSALLAQVADPDPLALYTYAKQSLMRGELVEDLEAMAKLFRSVVYEVTHVCYRCCELAMAHAEHVASSDSFSADLAETVLDVDNDEHSGGAGESSESADVAGTAGLLARLGALRRRYEAFLTQAAHESESARDLALWVCQQAVHWESGAYVVMGSATGPSSANAAAAYAEEDQHSASRAGGRANSPAPLQPPPSPQQPVLIDEVPVSATRQPALLEFVTNYAIPDRRVVGVASAFPSQVVSISGVEADDPASLYEQIVLLTEQHVSRFNAHTASPLCCRAVRIGGGAGSQESAADATQAGQTLLCCVVDDAADAEGKEEEDCSSLASSASFSAADCEGENGSSAASADWREKPPNNDDAMLFSNLQAASFARVSTQPARLYALQASPFLQGRIQPLHLSASSLLIDSAHQVEHDNGTTDEQAEEADKPALDSAACTVALLSAADIDTDAIAKYLKTDPTKEAGLVYSSSWYGFLEEDRHVVVCQPTAVLRSSHENHEPRVKPSAPFCISVVQDDGTPVVSDEREEESGDDEESSSNSEGECENKAADATDASAARVAVCHVTGMEGVPLRVSMSRARSFCVIVGVSKYVVVSLYDDDY